MLQFCYPTYVKRVITRKDHWTFLLDSPGHREYHELVPQASLHTSQHHIIGLPDLPGQSDSELETTFGLEDCSWTRS